MVEGKPSCTALRAAAYRAAHQILERGAIFRDPLALRILGTAPEAAVQQAGSTDAARKMRLFIAMRTRVAEDALAAAVATGVTQVVILGAGLDTIAYRSPWGSRVRIFEVDHPATQAWKRERLQAAGIEVPAWLQFASVDFERQILPEGLSKAGFERGQQTFFTWLGVVPYLKEAAIWTTLNFIANLQGGAHVVFDYSDPPDTLSDEAREFHDQRARRVAEAGEQWLTYFQAEPLRERLIELGFLKVEDLRPGQIVERFFPGRGKQLPSRGGHVLRASTV